VIMLTHNRDLHEVNLGWHSKAEDVLWQPGLQQAKRSQSGMWNMRYRNDVKREGVQAVTPPWRPEDRKIYSSRSTSTQ
jgi:hypothetical protein